MAEREAIERIARRSYGKLLAIVARSTRDLQAAEDALSDALSAALDAWPRDGLPSNPDGWLVTVARRKIIDRARRVDYGQSSSGLDRVAAALPSESEIPDERLALLFACAHPAIDQTARTPLLLRAVLGVELDRIASALLVSPAALKQRLTRAKAKIRDTGIRLEVPPAEHLTSRLAVVLQAIYAALTAGHDDPRAGRLADEAIELVRIVVELVPQEPEPRGLLALALHTAARRPARLAAGGVFVPLDEQDPSLWDAKLIDEAEAVLRSAVVAKRPGRFQLEAAIQSAHVARLTTGVADWSSVVRMYDLLLEIAPSIGAAVSRAAALAESEGSQRGLETLDQLNAAHAKRLSLCQPYWAVRGDLLLRLGRSGEADAAFERAIGLTDDAAVRDYLCQKRRRCE